MRLIAGASILTVDVHVDERGQLVALDGMDDVPFPMRRVFCIHVEQDGPPRGGHANSCDEFIVAVSGGVTLDLDNGYERCSTRLQRNNRGVWIQPGLLIDLRKFEPRTTLLVCASASYRQTRHFDRPQPHLYLAEAL